MASLMKRDGFVGNNRNVRGTRKSRGRDASKKTIPIVLLIVTGLLLLSAISATTTMSGTVKQSEGTAFSRVVENDFGSGWKNPQVISTPMVFVVATVNYGELTISFIDASNGNTAFAPLQFINDVNSYYFRIAYDLKYDKLMILWITNTGALNYTFIDGIENGNPQYIGQNFVLVNSSVQGTGLGLASDGNGHFLAVWSLTDNRNYLTFIMADDYSHKDIIPASDDTSHSHAQNFAAYDPESGNFIIVWRNSTGTTDVYNITGKIINSVGDTVVNDFLIADGLAGHSYFTYPTAEGGGGVFAVAYVNYNTTYDMHLVFYRASDGAYVNSVSLGNTAKYGVSYIGIAYNGSGFVVTWTNDNYDIVANNFDLRGEPALSTPRTIAGTSDSEEWQDVAYHPDTHAYYFVWYDYTDKHDHGSYWTESEFVPELSAFLPVMAVALVGIILLRRRH